MIQNIEQILQGAFEESFSKVPKEKVDRIVFEMNWRGREKDSFEDWFYNFFIDHRSQIFKIHQQEVADLIDADWKLARATSRKIIKKISAENKNALSTNEQDF